MLIDATRPDEVYARGVVFFHIPKCGGNSIIDMFTSMWGEDRCFRHKKRDRVTNKYSKSVYELSSEELNGFKFIAGHFTFEKFYEAFTGQWLNLAVVRDPVDRLVSDYYFNREFGAPDNMRVALAMSLNEYVESKLNNPNSLFARSHQTECLSGVSESSEAIKIIDENYFAVCSTKQLNDFQGFLARYFGFEPKEPFVSNVTSRTTKKMSYKEEVDADLLSELLNVYDDDFRLVQWAEKQFLRKLE